MRKILFRGKRFNDGEWISGFLVDERRIGNWLLCESVHPDTVGQFTGITDKNGKKIFEHDIVRFSNGVFVVVFYDCRMGFGFSGLFGRGCVPGFGMTAWEHIEIIGNIHDNPELLETA